MASAFGAVVEPWSRYKEDYVQMLKRVSFWLNNYCVEWEGRAGPQFSFCNRTF